MHILFRGVIGYTCRAHFNLDEMSANVPLRPGEHVNLDDLGGDALNENVNHGIGVLEILPVPSPTVSTRDQEGTSVQDIVVPRPCWMWTIAILDIVVACLDCVVCTSILHALMMKQHKPELYEPDRVTITFVGIIVHRLFQGTMGLLMIFALCIPYDKCLVYSFRAYLSGCYILIGMIMYVALNFFRIPNPMQTFGYDGWLQMVLHLMITMALRLWVTSYVKKLLREFHGTVSS